MNVYKVSLHRIGTLHPNKKIYLAAETLASALSRVPGDAEHELVAVELVLRDVLLPILPKALPSDGGPYR